MAKKVLKGIKQEVEGAFSAETGYMYMVRKSEGGGYVQLDGKKYGETTKDWQENDSGSSAYIENRTHYDVSEEGNIKTLVEGILRNNPSLIKDLTIDLTDASDTSVITTSHTYKYFGRETSGVNESIIFSAAAVSAGQLRKFGDLKFTYNGLDLSQNITVVISGKKGIQSSYTTITNVTGSITYPVKLDNKYLHLDDEVTEYSTNAVTSNAVYNALQNAGGLFVAEYESTTYQEIADAYNSGKTVILRNNDYIGQLSVNSEGERFVFIMTNMDNMDDPSVIYYSIDTNDEWTTNTIYTDNEYYALFDSTPIDEISQIYDNNDNENIFCSYYTEDYCVADGDFLDTRVPLVGTKWDDNKGTYVSYTFQTIQYLQDTSDAESGFSYYRITLTATLQEDGGEEYTEWTSEIEPLSLGNDIWVSGEGENSAVLKGSNGTAFGANSVVEGTSVTNAIERGITSESTDAEIIAEWSGSTPDTDKFSLAKGDASHVEGNNNLSLGINSHAEGNGTIAANHSSHSEGTGSQALGKYSHAEGLETIAEGSGSHTEGKETHASGDTSDYSHAEGEGTVVEVRTGHVEGYKSIAARSGYTGNTLTPHAQGTGTSSWVNAISHAEGNATIAQGLGAHSEGEKTFANGRNAHAEGLETIASGPYASHAEGEATVASGEDSHAEGWRSESIEQFTHAEGCDTTAIGKASHTEGIGSKTSDVGAHAEGVHGYKVKLKRTASKTFTNQTPEVTINVGDIDINALGRVTEVNGTTIKFSKDIFPSGTQNRVLTFGDNSLNTQSGAFGKASHAEGECTLSNGEATHAEGYFTKVDVATTGRTITGAHAEGYETFAGEWASHAEGYNSHVNGSATANTLTPDTDKYAGQMGHAEGNATLAKGNASHAEGVKTFTQNEGEHAEGQYNVSNTGSTSDKKTISSVGVGTADNARKNAFEIMQNGDVYVYGVGEYSGETIESADTLQEVISSLSGNTVWEKGSGGNSVQQKGTGAFAIGTGAVAEGEGETISFTITSVEEIGTNATVFNVSNSTTQYDLQHGDLLHYKKDSQEIWTSIFRAETNKIIVVDRFTPIPTTGGVLEVLRGIAYGQNSHSENAKTDAIGENSHSEGFLTNVRGFAAHAEGVKTKSDGWGSHSEGELTEAIGEYAHAEGKGTKVEGRASHSEGENTTAIGANAHSEGYGTTIESGADFSHVEGFGSQVSAVSSHAEGYLTTIHQAAQASHTEGYMTEVKNMAEHAEGRCNKSNTVVPVDPSAPTPEEMGKATLHSVGMGYPTNPNDPSTAVRMNAFEIMQNGDAYLYGVGGYSGTSITGDVKTLQEVLNNIPSKAGSAVIYLDGSDAGTDVFIGPYRTNANYLFVLENIGQPISYVGLVTDGNEGGNVFDVKGNIPNEIRYDKIVCSNGDAYVRINYHNIPFYQFSTNVTVTDFLGNETKILGSTTEVESQGSSISSTTQYYYASSKIGSYYLVNTTSGSYDEIEYAWSCGKFVILQDVSGYTYMPLNGSRYDAPTKFSNITEDDSGVAYYNVYTIKPNNNQWTLQSTALGGGGDSLWESGNGIYSIQQKGTGAAALADYAYAEGSGTTSSGMSSHAEGGETSAIGDASHAEGGETTAHGVASHAEGGSTTAYGDLSHAEGYNTTASGSGSHSEGAETFAYGDASHAEGVSTKAYVDGSHAEGSETVSSGICAHAEGRGTTALNIAEHAEGQFNISHTGVTNADNTQHSIGVGTSSENKKNAIEVMQNGDTYILGIGGYSGTTIYGCDTLQEELTVANTSEIDALFSEGGGGSGSGGRN